MKKFVLLVMIFIPVAFLYELLDKQFRDSWLSVGIFVLVLISGRVGLFIYRRSRGIKDTYLDN